jgi:hypothetical protein
MVVHVNIYDCGTFFLTIPSVNYGVPFAQDIGFTLIAVGCVCRLRAQDFQGLGGR